VGVAKDREKRGQVSKKRRHPNAKTASVLLAIKSSRGIVTFQGVKGGGRSRRKQFTFRTLEGREGRLDVDGELGVLRRGLPLHGVGGVEDHVPLTFTGFLFSLVHVPGSFEGGHFRCKRERFSQKAIIEYGLMPRGVPRGSRPRTKDHGLRDSSPACGA